MAIVGIDVTIFNNPVSAFLAQFETVFSTPPVEFCNIVESFSIEK